MAESEEASPPKQLVRAANGDLWLVKQGETPEKVHSFDPNLIAPKKPELVTFINKTNEDLANFFASANPGVKVGITVVDFDGQHKP